MFVCCVCCEVEVSATGWSLVQRALPTVARRVWLRNVVKWGGHSPHRAAEPEKKKKFSLRNNLCNKLTVYVWDLTVFTIKRQGQQTACMIYRTVSHTAVCRTGTRLVCIPAHHLCEKLQKVLDNLEVLSWRTNKAFPQEFNALYHSGVTNSTDKVWQSHITTQLYTCPSFAGSIFLPDAPTSWPQYRPFISF
jgi:hypothetical protein